MEQKKINLKAAILVSSAVVIALVRRCDLTTRVSRPAQTSTRQLVRTRAVLALNEGQRVDDEVPPVI